MADEGYVIKLAVAVPGDEIAAIADALSEKTGGSKQRIFNLLKTNGVGAPIAKADTLAQAERIADMMREAGLEVRAEIRRVTFAPTRQSTPGVGSRSRERRSQRQPGRPSATGTNHGINPLLTGNETSNAPWLANIVGYIGVAALLIGVFAPLLQDPLGIGLDYLGQVTGDVWIILALAVISGLMLLNGRRRYLWIPGILSLLLTGYAFTRVIEALNSRRNDVGDGAGVFGDALLSTVVSEWGWAFLVIGGVALLASALMRQSR